MNARILTAAARFHALAQTASQTGGMWVSAGGGTANVVAGTIARDCAVSFDDAMRALDVTGGPDWYSDLAWAQPWRPDAWFEDIPGRWDARTVARAACWPVRGGDGR